MTRSHSPSPLAGVNLLELRPSRRAEWSEREGRVVVERPAPRTQGLRGLADRISYLLSPRRIRLDPRGAFVWRRLDGRTTVAELAAALRDAFPDDAEQTEERLGLFVRLLRREGMVVYPGFDEEG